MLTDSTSVSACGKFQRHHTVYLCAATQLECLRHSPCARRKNNVAGSVFLWSEGVTGAEIHRRLSSQYGDSALPRRSVYEWIERFQHSRTSMKDEERAARPSTSITDSNVEDARAMILENRRVTTDELANHFEISHGSAYDIIHNRLGLQVGFLKSSPKSKRTIVWPSVNAYWTAMLTKVKLF